MKVPAIKRLMKRVEKTSDCWLWLGKLTKKGYARIRNDAGHYSYGHKVSYEHFIGPVPQDLVLDHLCRIPRCVNPLHLEPVTDTENIRRSPIHYANATHCKNGHEFTAQNTRIRIRRDGGQRERVCRVCHRKSAHTARDARRGWAMSRPVFAHSNRGAL